MEERTMAPPIIKGVEDKFYFVIGDGCISCGSCAERCPTKAICMGDRHYEIDKSLCIDCGTCAYVCPVGAPHAV